MFTLEIEKKAVAVVNIDDLEDAESFFTEEAFKADLTVLQNEGMPLWNGASKLLVRRSDDLEKKLFELAYSEGLKSGHFEHGDEEDAVIWLVDISDPTDEDFDEEGFDMAWTIALREGGADVQTVPYAGELHVAKSLAEKHVKQRPTIDSAIITNKYGLTAATWNAEAGWDR